MKRTCFLLAACLVLLVTPGLLQAQAPQGMSVTCDDGTSFDNGIEFMVSQMRSGYTYTATAIGLNGFDPVLAVLNTKTGNGLCNDDKSAASSYAADLPTTGSVSASNLSAQVSFSQNTGSSFANMSLVVGGYGNASGEFLLILEGMAATKEDNAGDIYSVNLTPGMVASGIPLTVYMIAADDKLDPYIYQVGGDMSTISDSQGNAITCDDAGDSSLCYGDSTDLSSSSVTLGAGTLPGGPYDAMLSVSLNNLSLNSDRSQNFYNFVMTSSPQNKTEGQYVLVFHAGMGAASSANDSGSAFTGGKDTESGQSQQSPQVPTPQPNNTQSSDTGTVTGMSVTCDNGASFDNGVEVIVNDMPSGVTYTATAIGLNGFDPVLAVLNTDSGEGQCNDDASGAASYAANLPTSGSVPASTSSAQITFTQDTGDPTASMSLVVGGYGNQNGEFLLILEGMSISKQDTGGDIYDINLTPGMVASGVPMSLYMISASDALDPYILMTDAKLNPITDNSGSTIACDDAGTSDLCWSGSNSTDLSNSTLTLAPGDLAGWQYDAMLSIDLTGMTPDSDMSKNYFTFVMNTSPQNPTTGPYVFVLHAGVGASA